MFIQNFKRSNLYKTNDGLINYYDRFYDPANKIENPLIIINGAEDPLPLWFKTVESALAYGFKEVYLIEIRGQGQSERVRGNTKNALHVKDFRNYYYDLFAALKHISQIHRLTKPVYILSHSTGSTIITNTLPLIKKDLPYLKVQAMSFWAPLVKLQISPYLNNFIVRPILSMIDRVYSYFGGLLIVQKYELGEFQKNKLTSDEQSFTMLQDLKFKFGLGSTGVSLRWVLEALKELNRFSLEKIKVPTLLLKADQEIVVDNAYRVNNTLITVDTITDTKHALHIETDKAHNDITERTFNYFIKNGPN